MKHIEIIQARIDELQLDLEVIVKEMQDKQLKLASLNTKEDVQEVVSFIQRTTLQTVGLRSAIAELRNVKGMM